MLDQEAGLQRAVELLQGVGYRAHLQPGHIATSVSGYNAIIFYNDTIGALQFYAGFAERHTAHFSYEQANIFNANYKFTRCLVKDTGAVAFQADFMFDLEAVNAGDWMLSSVKLFEFTLNKGIEAMDKAEEEGGIS